MEATWRCACSRCLCFARVPVMRTPCGTCRNGSHTKNASEVF